MLDVVGVDGMISYYGGAPLPLLFMVAGRRREAIGLEDKSRHFYRFLMSSPSHHPLSSHSHRIFCSLGMVGGSHADHSFNHYF
jgi:hypothetical protein